MFALLFEHQRVGGTRRHTMPIWKDKRETFVPLLKLRDSGSNETFLLTTVQNHHSHKVYNTVVVNFAVVMINCTHNKTILFEICIDTIGDTATSSFLCGLLIFSF